jgi:ribonuclease HII
LVRDSKALSPRQRNRAACWIRANCADYVVVEVWPELIDRINILQAVRLAMGSVLAAIADDATVAVLDHVDLESPPCPVRSEPRADSAYFCVAAASILAKVHRDQVMVVLDRQQPEWGWSRNKGYGTEEHRRALQQHGRSYLHRRTFTWRPVLP